MPIALMYIHTVKTEFKNTSFVVWFFFVLLTDLFQIYLEYYTVFRVKWCTYLPGSPKLNKQANPIIAFFRITGGKNLAGSQACQMENLFWMAKCYEIVKFLGLTQRPTQCYMYYGVDFSILCFTTKLMPWNFF